MAGVEGPSFFAHMRSYLVGWLNYLLGRNMLIRVATVMLLSISCYATWSGLHDFIIGISSTPVRRLPGVPIDSDVFVIGIVVALTFLMWLALRETFGAKRFIRERLITFPLYLFLALWSIGFGYGFWWSLIAGEEATHNSLSGLQQDARDAGSAIAARLQAVQAQLDNVVSWSDSQMARENASGGTCGVPSGAGRGPLYNARLGVRDSVASLRNGISKSWLGPVQADLDQLGKNVAVPDGGTFEERQARFESKAADVRATAISIAARSNELGVATAGDMRALAAAVSIQPNQPGFSCYDPTLAQRLLQAADQAAQKADPQLRPANFSEGPAGVANAVKTLWTNVGAYGSSLMRFVASGGKERFSRTESGQPITGRDVIALLATIGIDLGILAMALLNPPATGPQRRDALVGNDALLHVPSHVVIERLTRAIQTATARAPDINFEAVQRHFIHHNGSSYFVIPNLSHVRDENEELRALAMNQLAGVFAELNLVRALKPREYKRFARQEKRTPGVLSKAQRALEIGRWSDEAQKDAEIFQLTETRILTPLLMVLNDADPGNTERPPAAQHLNGSAANGTRIPAG